MKLKIFECEERTTSSGKPYKSLTIQQEGKNYVDKYVSCWSDFPDFENIKAGITIDAEIESKDSTKPNPHGGFFKNKTLRPVGSQQPKNTPTSDQTARILNMLEFQIMPALKSIIAWQERQDIDKKGLNPDEIDKAFGQEGASPF